MAKFTTKSLSSFSIANSVAQTSTLPLSSFTFSLFGTEINASASEVSVSTYQLIRECTRVPYLCRVKVHPRYKLSTQVVKLAVDTLTWIEKPQRTKAAEEQIQQYSLCEEITRAFWYIASRYFCGLRKIN